MAPSYVRPPFRDHQLLLKRRDLDPRRSKIQLNLVSLRHQPVFAKRRFEQRKLTAPLVARIDRAMEG
jgi:hypothetical protein